jgi:protease II
MRSDCMHACRGGGELGGGWWKAACRLHKHVSIDDLIACALYLIAHRWTAAVRLTLYVIPKTPASQVV